MPILKKFYCLLFFTFLFFAGIYAQPVSDLSAQQIVKQMIEKATNISSMTYTMKKKERINGTYPLQETAIKLNVNPFKIYFRQKSPKDGLEVLYVQNSNSNKALVNTNGFPWVNLHLDPMGSIMRNNQHHTIYQSGYAHLMSILDHLINKYKKSADKIIRRSAEGVIWDGRQCWVIYFENPDFKYLNYTVQPGESVLTIADRLKLSEHMILELNKISSYDLIPGKSIIIPNDYSPKLELYVDKQLFIPLVMKVFDDKGLYEYYEYTNVKINPRFSDKDFDKDNPDYNF